MPNESHSVPRDLNKILERVSQLEARVERIEQSLEKLSAQTELVHSGLEFNESQVLGESVLASPSSVGLEFRIGEFWLAQLGSIVLLLGIAFFISYPFESISPILTSFLGYLAVAGVFGLSFYWSKNFKYLSKILFGAGLFLTYFATLRLHFFNPNPVLADKVAGLVPLIAVLGALLYFSLKRASPILTGLSLFLCYATSLFSDTTHFTLILIALSAMISVYFYFRFQWRALLMFSLVSAYFAHMIWMLNNPIMGKPMQALAEHHFNLFYVYLYAGTFACASLLPTKEKPPEFFELFQSLANSVGFLILGSLVSLTFFKSNIELTSLGMAIFFITMAIWYWLQKQSKYGSAVYVSFAYMTLSIAIFAQFDAPDYFVWLSWQSLLVISTAIWFRSRIIIVVNIFIFLAILLLYLNTSPSHDFVNLSYAVVALVSARILNWQKDRLQLKTDMIRNAYLISAYVMVLYGLYHAVPGYYVSVSWLLAALFYFGLSLLLKNTKYRWMAFATIFAMMIHVLFVDMARLSAEFRILFFIVVGLVLLMVSLIYSKYRKKISQM
ncbi:MAG: DUF2339 domain-containing protein [bacterium]